MRDLINEFKQIYKTLISRKTRTTLTMVGIVIGVAGVIIIIALGAGAQSLVLSQVTALGSDLINVLPGKTNESGPPAAVFGIQVTTLINSDVNAIMDSSRVPNLVTAAGVVTGSATVVWRSSSTDTSFTATQAPYAQIHEIELDQGRFFDARQELGANVVVLGWDVKQQLFGDQPAIGEVIKIDNLPLEVVGVAKAKGAVAFQNMDDTVYIPLIIGQQQLLGIRHLQSIRAKIDAPENVDLAIADVTQVLRERHRISDPANDDFEVRNLADAIDILTSVTDSLSLFLTVMAAMALVVGGIGIMNIMLVTVAERTREIGLRKALGATNRRVRNQFLYESSLLTLIGGIGGIVIGTLISYLIALGARYAGFEWAFVISPLSILLAVGVSILTGIVFGLYPARKAAKLDPISALRYE